MNKVIKTNAKELEKWLNSLGAGWNLFGDIDRAKVSVKNILAALKNMESSSRIIHRRELLEAFCESLDGQQIDMLNGNMNKEVIDDFLASNSG